MVNQKAQAEIDALLLSLKDSASDKLAKANEEAHREAIEKTGFFLPESEKTDRERKQDRLAEAKVKCDAIGTDSPVRKECLDQVEEARRAETRKLEEAVLEEVKGDLAAGTPPSSPAAESAEEEARLKSGEDRGYDYGMSQ